MKRLIVVPLIFALACATASPPPAAPAPSTELVPPPVVTPPPPSYTPGEPRVATLDSRAPLITIRVMITHGSTSDPAGKEGLATLVSDAVTDGGYRHTNDVVTKEELAEITMPWGSGARPTVFSSSRRLAHLLRACRPGGASLQSLSSCLAAGIR